MQATHPVGLCIADAWSGGGTRVVRRESGEAWSGCDEFITELAATQLLFYQSTEYYLGVMSSVSMEIAMFSTCIQSKDKVVSHFMFL